MSDAGRIALTQARRVKLSAVLLFAVGCCCCWAAASTASPQAGAPVQSPQSGEARGRRIYFAGEDGTADEIRVLLGGEEIDAPGTAFACVSCHGADGAGTDEGGIRPPPVNWTALTSPGRSTLTNRARIAYDEPTLRRALRRGLNSSGEPLHVAMPRYLMTEAQAAELISFLKVLGTERDADPGVEAQSIRVGAALPLTGALADLGAAARATLAAYFDAVNTRGGVYGRRFELSVEDSGSDPGGTLAATRRLVEARRVFALVGSFEPAGDAATREYLAQQSTPLVGALTLTPKPAVPPNPWVFYLLPSVRDQARALVEFVYDESRRGPPAATPPASAAASPARGREAAPARIALVNADDDLNREAADGARAQARARGMTVVLSRTVRVGGFSAAELASELASARPDYLFFFGGPRELGELANTSAVAERPLKVAGLALTLGRAALALPPPVAARTYLAHPTPLPAREGFAEFAGVLRVAGAPPGQIAFQAAAFGAAKTLVEAVKMSERRLSRHALVGSLERLRAFETGVLAPQTFGANRRVGPAGAYIVGVDSTKKQFVPLSGWLALND